MHTKEAGIVSVSVASPSLSLCAEDSVHFSVKWDTNEGLHPTYQWQVNGQSPRTGANSVTFIYLPNNNDIVTCILYSSDSCVIGNPASSLPDTVRVYQPVDPAPIIAGKDTICQGYPNSYSTTNASDVVEEWQFKNPNGVWTQVPSSEWKDSIIDIAHIAGTIEYRTVIKSGACPPQYSDSVDVLILESPGLQTLVPKADAEHEKKGDLFLLCTSCNNSMDYTYEWSYHLKGGSSNIITEFKNMYFCIFPVRDTSYTYVLNMGLSDQSCQTPSTYKIPTSTKISNMVSVFPIPNDGRFTLSLEWAYTGEFSILVQDLVGRTLVHSIYQKQSDSMQIPFNLSLEKGLYLISVLLGNDEKVTTRLLIY
jgi:hypothetical protein